MSNISLTASMRNNLLSLQQISKLQDQTQLRLSTGLKVNSAIDNPSSYYTAQSLTNRADDLSALLDAMGQGIQTIKAATEGLEKAEDLITQMKAIAEQVNTGSYVPEKEYFIQEVGDNGAVVSTADELRQAIADGKEKICVYGNINLGDISTTGGLSLQENQKLVGVNYFGNYKDGEGFSSISATASVAKNMINITKTGCLVSDLSLNYKNTVAKGNSYAIRVGGIGVETTVQNLDIYVQFSEDKDNLNVRAAIASTKEAIVNIKENCNIQTFGQRGIGIFSQLGAYCNISENSKINIQTNDLASFALYALDAGNFNIESNAQVNIETKGNTSYGVWI